MVDAEPAHDLAGDEVDRRPDDDEQQDAVAPAARLDP